MAGQHSSLVVQSGAETLEPPWPTPHGDPSTRLLAALSLHQEPRLTAPAEGWVSRTGTIQKSHTLCFAPGFLPLYSKSSFEGPKCPPCFLCMPFPLPFLSLPTAEGSTTPSETTVLPHPCSPVPWQGLARIQCSVLYA